MEKKYITNDKRQQPKNKKIYQNKTNKFSMLCPTNIQKEYTTCCRDWQHVPNEVIDNPNDANDGAKVGCENAFGKLGAKGVQATWIAYL